MKRFIPIVAVVSSLFMANAACAFESYSIDGSGNNLANPNWGQTDSELLRLASNAYDDGLSTPRGGDPSSLPSPRAISNAVAAQSSHMPNSVGASDWLWQWGQFLDHDLDLTDAAEPHEAFNIPVPITDALFDPFQTGTQEIGLNRSAHVLDGSNVRQQVNRITAYIDGSNIYGSDATRAATLRFNDGTGKMMMTVDGLLMFNTFGLPNDGGPGSNLFVSGDIRANEQIGLTATHTLFSREHNRIADDLKSRLDANETALVAKRDQLIAEAGNGVDDEGDFIYESTRKLVTAQLQKITYEEFLPTLMGDALPAYAGYDDTVNASISNEFSTAAYRVGHTMLSSNLLRLNNDGTEAPEGNILLRDSFFNPSEISNNGIDSLMKGLASQMAQNVDTKLIDDVRNFLFGPPGSGGFDLASLNLQRGRDHGLQPLNATRMALGLGAHATFLDLTGGDATLANALASVYASIDDVDLWIGGLAESHVNGGLLGETFDTIIDDQFTRLRDGDRLFYLGQLEHLRMLDPNFDSTTLSEIILRNTELTNLQSNVFVVVPEPGAMLLAMCAAVGLARISRAA